MNKKALAFMLGGKQVFARRVQHPPIQERSFMRSSLEEMRPGIIAGLEETIQEIARQ